MWLVGFFNELDHYVPREELRQYMHCELLAVTVPFLLRGGAFKLWHETGHKKIKEFCGGDLFVAAVLGRAHWHDPQEQPPLQPLQSCPLCGGDVQAALLSRSLVRNEQAREAATGVELTPRSSFETSEASQAGGTPAGHVEHAETASSSRVLDRDLAYRSWTETRLRLGFGKRRLAVAVSVLRILFWHLLQPLFYLLVFYTYTDRMESELLLGLGFAVALRELTYVVVVFACIAFKPGIFLYAPVENHCGTNMAYVVCPEKFLLTFLLTDTGFFLCLPICVMDLCSFGALLIMLLNQLYWWPLFVGYGVTAVSGLVIPVALLTDRCNTQEGFK